MFNEFGYLVAPAVPAAPAAPAAPPAAQPENAFAIMAQHLYQNQQDVIVNGSIPMQTTPNAQLAFGG